MGFLHAENLVQLKAVTGGPRAIPSVLASMLTLGFYPCLHGSLPVCEAGHEVREASGRFPSRLVLLPMGLRCAQSGAAPASHGAWSRSEDPF